MSVDVLLGLQWGDEGKGKIVDYLAPKFDVVTRFQGGPNAGHSLEFDGHKHVLHQIPSGIFRSGIKNVIGNGVVLDPVIFRKEIDGLAQYDLDYKDNLYISKKTQLILPTHKLIDAASEKAKGKEKIGSTLKGIGPTYQDKIGRFGIRVGDVLTSDFKARYAKLVSRHLGILKYYEYSVDNLEALEEEFFSAIEFLKTFQLTDSEYLINDFLKEGKSILAEGAQGSLLDIDFGSYPFVTSSNTMTAGACTGMGVAPQKIKDVYGIFKAYCTRVGSGPFPTELHEATGERLRKVGSEFGATTGRPRRCGWLDLPALNYAVILNGVTQLFITKVDVLNAFEEIKVCTGYRLADGTETNQIPYDLCDETIEPIYKSFKGWNQEITSSSFEDFPEELKTYLSFIESQVKVPITLVSVGPDREQTILQ